MKKIFMTLGVFTLVALLSSCGGSIDGKLTFAALKTTGSGSASLNDVRINDASVDESSTWAHVDGLKVKLISVNLTKDGGGEEEIYSNTTGSLVTLTPDGGNVELSASISEGTYTGAQMKLDASYDLKAWACLGDGNGTYDVYYTTTSGIVHKAVQTVCVAPTESSYGYYNYKFLYLSTADSPTSTSDTAQESGVAEFNATVSSGDSPTVQVVMDIYRLVTFWDGTGSRISPFSWSNNNGYNNTDFFPDGTPNFGVSYIPMFLSLNDSGNTLGRIYVFSDDQTKVNNFSETNPDSTLSYFVLATTSDGSYLGSRIVGFDDTNFDQFNSEFNTSGNLASFYNGEHCSDSSLSACDSTGRFLKNIRITNFDMGKSAGESFQMTVVNTEYCDDTVTDPDHPEWGNRMHCLSVSPATYYVKRIK